MASPLQRLVPGRAGGQAHEEHAEADHREDRSLGQPRHSSPLLPTRHTSRHPKVTKMPA